MNYKENFVGYTLSNKVGLHYEHNNTYAISVDRLVLNLTAKQGRGVFTLSTLEKDFKTAVKGIYNIDDVFYLQRLKKGQGNYLYSFDISFDGKKIGKLHLNNMKTGCSKLVKLEFSNDVHYSIGTSAKGYYDHITQALALRLHNITYLEIALDTYDMFERFKYMYLNSKICDRNLFAHIGRAVIATQENNGQFIVGAKSTGKKIAIYIKSKEIEKNAKHYISEHHKRNGLDAKKQIDRVELRMDSRWLKKCNITLEMLENSEGLCSIFKEYTKDSLSFHDLSTKYYDANNNKKYERADLIDYTMFNCRPLEKPDGKQKVRGSQSIRRTTSAFKHLIYSYIKDGKEDEIEYLRTFISRKANWLVGLDEFDEHFGLMEKLEAINREKYMVLTKRYIDEYDGPINAEVIYRMENIYSFLFCYTALTYDLGLNNGVNANNYVICQ